MGVFLESWSPLLDVRSRSCVLWLSCLFCFSLILQVNFVWLGCWLTFFTIIITPAEFVLKLQRSLHLLGGDYGAAYELQHLHQRGWARECMSCLDNHPLLLYPLIVIDWKLGLSAIYLQWLGIDIYYSVWCLFCYASLLILAAMVEFQTFWICSLIVLHYSSVFYVM